MHPYASVGIGAAFNATNKYKTSTQESGSINLTPVFHDKSQAEFSYSLGLGIDTDISQKIRIGLGYRFSDFGKASLGSGQVVLNNYNYPVPFSLSTNRTYANQFIAQISYLA